MTDQVTAIAVQNAPLLRAIKEGGHTSATALAEKAGVIRNNVNRQLDIIEAEGLISRTEGAPTHEAALTQKGEAALAILSLRMIPANRVLRWPDNPRSEQTLVDDELQSLARSIGDKGVLQPIIVRPRPGAPAEEFEVIAGDRRRRAAQIAVANGWQPADFLIPAQVRELTDDEAVEIAGVENIQRDDMHWMDEAKWFLRLSGRMSAAEISRLIGGERKKRSIQDYTKIARELTPEDIARTYLPDNHPDQLTYVKARDLVGEKKEKPALELSPRVALTLVELTCAGELQAGGKEIVTKLHAPPAGGPMATLAEKKLVTWRFVEGVPAAVIALSDDLRQWMAQVGHAADSDGGLRRARIIALGDLQASTIPDGQWVTPELNAPEPRPAAAPAPQAHEPDEGGVETPTGAEPAGPGDTAGGPPDDPYYPEAVAFVTSTGNGSVSHLQRHMQLGYNRAAALVERMEREGVLSPVDVAGKREVLQPAIETPPPADDLAGPAAQTLAPPPTPPADEFDLPPMLAIVAVEAAHKIATSGVEKGPGTWVAPVREAYYKDARSGLGVQKHRTWAFMPYARDVAGIAITPRLREWLVKTFDLVEVGDGRLIMDDELLVALQERLAVAPVDDGPYATFWLNPISQAAAAALSPPPAPVPADETSHEPMSFSEQLRAMGAEERVRVVERLCAALKEARRALSTAASRRLNAPEIAQHHALIDSALEAAGSPLEDA